MRISDWSSDVCSSDLPRPAPAPAPPPQPASRPEPASARPLVTRAEGEKRAVVGMALDIRSIRFAPDHVAVGFAPNLLNQGTVPPTGLMVQIGRASRGERVCNNV